jgi:Reverse transcriptase (RNA-dependent DNA polymerase).
VVPELWNTALIIPVLKPGKSSSDAVNYRPISLLCCMNKIMEKMISKRLKWLIEDRQLVDTYQNGNRKQRSTMDNLVLLEQETITALQNHEYVIAVFLDINKFYDRISKVTILEKLIEKNIGGPMFYYLDNFLSNPQIQVSIDGVLSSGRTLANGIRQGSSLSGDLSNIATSNLAKCIPRNVMHGCL